MKLRKFGFFDELSHEEAREVLVAARSEQPRPNEEKILGYLKDATPLLAVTTVLFDGLSDDRRPIGPYDILTDGVWAWSSDAIYYVERYHILVPPELQSHMAHNRWQCPPVTDFKNLELEGWGRLGPVGDQG